ncbi:DinB family protein [Paenibacillus sp. TAF58]
MLMETLQRFEEITNRYLEQLHGITIEQLTYQQSEAEWSIGQMYLHLINTALQQLRNAEQCMIQTAEPVGSIGGKTEAGKAVFEQAGFPPVRIQVPASPQYTPGQPESIDQLVQGMNSVRQRMKEIGAMLDSAPLQTLQNTVSHPRLGDLHAKEWFMFVEMHYRHHLLQKDRLKKVLESAV